MARKIGLTTGVKIAGAVLCVFTLGFLVLRPRLRASVSPRVQNGLTLVTQHTGLPQPATNTPASPLQTVVQWINQRFFPTGSYVTEIGFPCVEIALPKGAKPNTVLTTARASTGDVFSLLPDDWMSGLSASSVPATRPPHVFVRLPAMPQTYKWVDVTVDDNGRTGTWRITNLPRLKHALSPVAPLHETETVQKVPLEARAWWDSALMDTDIRGDFANLAMPLVVEVRGVVPQNALALPSHSWTVSIDGLTQEWEPASRALPFVRGKSSDSGCSMSSSGVSVMDTIKTTASAQAANAPYPAAQTRAKIDATLTLRDAHDESVTFRDVPLEKSGKGLRVRAGSKIVVTTPSGVRVRLLAPRDASAFGSPASFNDVDIMAEASPENGIVPGSPLQKRVGNRPLHISCHIPFSGEQLTSMQTSGKVVRWIYKKRLPRPVLPALTVTVSQTAEIKTIPVSFMVPVRAGKPKIDWQQ